MKSMTLEEKLMELDKEALVNMLIACDGEPVCDTCRYESLRHTELPCGDCRFGGAPNKAPSMWEAREELKGE